jgi:8-oxo-dGTP pyrophosphatase MutT (NUDIX family)
VPTAPFAPRPPQACDRPADLAEARRQIEGAVLAGAAQEAVRARTLSFVEAHPDALHRHCRAGHLTGSAVVVDDDRQRVVLLHHRKLDRWLQPGGHADGDGDLAGVARREAAEETGLADLRVVAPAIDLDVHPIPARGPEHPHHHYDLRFVVLAGPGAQPRVNHESIDVRWVRIADLDDYGVSGELRHLVERGLAVARRL